MDVLDLLKLGKDKIRENEETATLFSLFFKEKFNKEPSFCCRFSDYNKLRDSYIMSKKMRLKKFELKYNPRDILVFKKNKRVHRLYAKDVDDNFIEYFIKLHNPSKFKDVDKKIIQIKNDSDVKEVQVKSGLEKTNEVQKVGDIKKIIETATLEDLVQFESDKRKGVVSAIEARKKVLNKVDDNIDTDVDADVDDLFNLDDL